MLGSQTPLVLWVLMDDLNPMSLVKCICMITSVFYLRWFLRYLLLLIVSGDAAIPMDPARYVKPLSMRVSSLGLIVIQNLLVYCPTKYTFKVTPKLTTLLDESYVL